MNGTLKAFLIFLLILALLAGGAFLYYRAEVSGLFRSSEPVAVHIEKGSSAAAVADSLKEAGVIGNTYVFRFYLRSHPASFQYGTFSLTPRSGYDAVIQELESGAVQRDSETLTVTEGSSVPEIADQLVKLGLGSREEVLDVMENEPFAFDFLPEKAEGALYRLEGYLFPDTYEIYPDATRENIVSVVEKMLRNFEVKTAELRREAAAQEKDWRELVILASIVEKEGQKAEELPVISAVFQNRLADGMKLESCATVQYVLPEHKEVLSYEDIAVESPYNTYLYEGLTPGPIGNPGLLALKAALQPADSDYYFFVARADGSHYFARTYAEHEANIQKSNSEG